jgi:heterodisulfide reductase subunit C
MDPEVFKILLDLIKLNVSPTALVQVLRKVAARKGYADDSRGTSKSSSLSQSDLGQTSQSDSSLARTDKSVLSNRLKELKAQMQMGH